MLFFLQNSRVCRPYSLSYLQDISYLVSFFWSAPVLSNISLCLLKFDHNRPHAPIEPLYLRFLPPSFQEATGRRKSTIRLSFKRCPWFPFTLLYGYLVRSVGTRRSLLTRNLNKFQERKPPLHLHSLNTFLLWVGQTLLLLFDCGPATLYPTEEGTSSTRVQPSWSSLEICVYLQASLQRFSKVVKKTQNQAIKLQKTRCFLHLPPKYILLFSCLNFVLTIKKV